MVNSIRPLKTTFILIMIHPSMNPATATATVTQSMGMMMRHEGLSAQAVVLAKVVDEEVEVAEVAVEEAEDEAVGDQAKQT